MKFCLLFILIFTSNKSCNISKKAIELDRIYRAVYVKDTTEYNIYWLQSEKFEDRFILTDLDRLYPYALLGCEKLELPKGENIDIHELTLRGKIEHTKDAIYHVGGDVYMDQQERLVISFRLNAEVIKLVNEPCKDFSVMSSYYCPVSFEKIEYPFYILSNILASKSLSENEIKHLNLKRVNFDRFKIGECD